VRKARCINLSLHHSCTGTFRPDRIRSIADRFGVDGNMALENILYGMNSFLVKKWFVPDGFTARAFNSEHQVTLCRSFEQYNSHTL
jgi:hypothetical protein